MTFLEAAIEILRQAGRPLHFKELTERAVQQNLLSHLGRTPEATMQARLAQELKKGDRTQLVREKPGVFGLRRYDRPKGEPAAPRSAAPAAKPATKPARGARGGKPSARTEAGRAAEVAEPAARTGARRAAEAAEPPVERTAAAGRPDETAADAAGEKEGKRRRRRRGRGKKDATAASAKPGRTAEGAQAELEVEPGTPEEALLAERLAAEAEASVAEPPRPPAPEAPPVAERSHAAAAAEPTRAPTLAPPATVATPPAGETFGPAAGAPPAPTPLASAPAAGVAHDDSPRPVPPPRPAREPEEPVVSEGPEDEPPPFDLDAFQPPPPRHYRMPVDIPHDEDALAAEYADELVGGVTPPVAGEMVDERTADEDRPMLAEIGGRDRRHRRRRERDPKEKGREEGRRDERREAAGRRGARPRREGEARAAEPRRPHEPRRAERDRGAKERPEERRDAPPAPAPSAPVVTVRPAAPTTPGLADVACQLLRALNDGRPVHARQLAAMALKRKLATGDVEDVGRGLKVALLDDSRARQAAGLRARVRHHGGSLFSLTELRLDPELRAVEEGLAARAEELHVATIAAMRQRLVRLPLPTLEQLAHVLLQRLGWRDVERIKRSEEAWYLTATARRGAVAVRALVSVRPGGTEVGRRAVGELRAGVQAKQMDEGILFAAGPLGPEGLRELGAQERLVTVYDGAAFAEELVRAGVGVARAAVPVTYLDVDFFGELTET